MISLALLIFCLGYILITLEHPIGLNKTATALLMAALLWACIALGNPTAHNTSAALSIHLSGIAEILFFLLGAMTLVELIDLHHGFDLISEKIKSRKPAQLLVFTALLSFFLAALLDNLAASIVMVSLLRKWIKDSELRKTMAGMVILATNAGGLWSPIGSITTTMLWIGHKLDAQVILKSLFLPSLANIALPLLILGLRMRKLPLLVPNDTRIERNPLRQRDRILMLCIGLTALLAVSIFKVYTHLPPYMGMLFSLGAVWIASEILHRGRDQEVRQKYSVAYALSRIDSTSILFFLGILLAVAALEHLHILNNLAVELRAWSGSDTRLALLVGLASAIVDNVPLVAASMSMFDPQLFPANHPFWQLIAYTAGTGGSILIIGSAAGVAVMGMERLDFLWFLKRFSLLALLGYFSGAIVYLALQFA